MGMTLMGREGGKWMQRVCVCVWEGGGGWLVEQNA